MSELIDRQAFIEQERKLYCEDCDRRKGTKNGKPNVICYEIGEVPCRACWLDDALGDLEDFPAASPWHRVEEPPKEHGPFLCAAKSKYNGHTHWCFELCWYADGDLQDAVWDAEQESGFYSWSESQDRDIYRMVGYWMPIEPPKEDA